MYSHNNCLQTKTNPQILETYINLGYSKVKIITGYPSRSGRAMCQWSNHVFFPWEFGYVYICHSVNLTTISVTEMTQAMERTQRPFQGPSLSLTFPLVGLHLSQTQMKSQLSLLKSYHPVHFVKLLSEVNVIRIIRNG